MGYPGQQQFQQGYGPPPGMLSPALAPPNPTSPLPAPQSTPAQPTAPVVAPSPATNAGAPPRPSPPQANQANQAKQQAAPEQPKVTPVVAKPNGVAAPANLPPPPPAKPRSYANPGPPLPTAPLATPTPVVPSATPASAARNAPKRDVEDVQQLVKDMSLQSRQSNGSHVASTGGARGGQGRRDAAGPGVGGSVFGLANANTNNNARRQQQPGQPGGGRQLQPFGSAPVSTTLPLPASDFDFQQSNAKFNKDDAPRDEEDEVVIPPASADTFYDKQKSFFDNVSSDVKERTEMMAGQGQRFDRSAERNKNLDTFGESGGYGGGMRRGRGRGGYRGGRGGVRSFPFFPRTWVGWS